MHYRITHTATPNSTTFLASAFSCHAVVLFVLVVHYDGHTLRLLRAKFQERIPEFHREAIGAKINANSMKQTEARSDSYIGR